jgi:hypothetical protein
MVMKILQQDVGAKDIRPVKCKVLGERVLMPDFISLSQYTGTVLHHTCVNLLPFST